MSTVPQHAPLSQFAVGAEIGVSDWVTVTQDMIDRFGDTTLDPDPMHIDPVWARQHGPFGGTIAFGFLTVSLLTRLFHAASNTQSAREPHTGGYYLNYGFDRLRLISPVPAGARIRGRFGVAARERDDKGRWRLSTDCTIEIEGHERPALVARWLSMWVPPEAQ